jgi:hypothetical protein
MLINCPLNINTLKADMANIISRRHIPTSLPFKLSAPEIMQLKWTSCHWTAELSLLVKHVLICDEPPFM